ncbi:MAG: GIY-YIG nuclease family protein [Planctomycetota bacterium]|jgi:hypothetical protein
MIYFIQETGLFRNRVKIGFTDNIKDRLASLRSSSPSALKLTLVLPGDIKTELVYHERFSKYRLHREWFRYGLQLRLFVWVNRVKSLEADVLTIDEDPESSKTIVELQPNERELCVLNAWDQHRSFTGVHQELTGAQKPGGKDYKLYQQVLNKFEIKWKP